MNGIQTYRQGNRLSPAVLAKLEKSKSETSSLSMRDIRCPYCGFLVDRVYSDISGHKEIFCRKCKEKYTINLGYFRRQKKLKYFKIFLPDTKHWER